MDAKIITKNIFSLFLSIILSFFSFLSCENSSKITFIDLEATVEITELSDSTFFRDISYISCYDYIYASDVDNSRVLKLDADLNLLGTIGRRGQGPGDFVGLGCIALWKDTVLALNAGGLSLNTYKTDGQFIECFSFRDYSLFEENFCIDNEGFLYFTSYLDSFSIVKYDRKMNRQFGFGERTTTKNEEFRHLNLQLIAYFEDKILTVQFDAPTLNLYEKDGKHILKKELPEQLFERRLGYKKSEQGRDASNLRKLYKLFGSIASKDNKIYLSYIEHDDNDIPYMNKVVELIYIDNDFLINKVYSLSNSNKAWFRSIAVTKDNKIIASNTSIHFDPSLGIFQLK
jgi:hypothetical protein